MSRIIDPSTGRPLRQEIPQEAIIQAIQVLEMKIAAATRQVIQNGIFVEWMAQKLEEAEIDLDIENFDAFAQEQWRKLEEMSTQQLQQPEDAPQEQESPISLEDA